MAEEAELTTFALRRGDAARYALRPHLKLVQSGGVRFLFSRRPLFAMRLNRCAWDVLAQLDGPIALADLLDRPSRETLTQINQFLENLFERGLLEKYPPPVEVWPTVSVIIPSRNRPYNLTECIASLRSLDYPAQLLEIIVVDDASDPPLAPLLEELQVKVLRQECNVGPSQARNIGAAEATGDLLAFLDDDCLADRCWLRLMIPWLKEPGVSVVGGRVRGLPSSGGIAAYEAQRSPLDMGAVSSSVGPGRAVSYLPSCNLVVWRDVFRALGGFDAGMRVGEDVDFAWRALETGFGARYVHDGVVYHRHRTHLASFLCRRRDYGSSEADLSRRHASVWRGLSLPATSALFALAVGMSLFSMSTGFALAALTTLSLLADYGRKRSGLQRLGAKLGAWQVGSALLSTHGAGIYHLCAALLRYHGLLLVVLAFIFPPLLPLAVLVAILPPAVEYFRRRPALTLARFTLLYWVEMLAYQLGVWWGCYRFRNMRPMLPRFWFRL